ncbi:MAG: isochorismatase family protein [Deltaproteobacteria bacterium]|nr:isochorismatase family protein [Deltaproteobacteria bacterium]
MPAEVGAQVVKHTRLLIDAATRLGVPILVSQQYPKGLGATVAELEAALTTATAAGAAVHRFDKVEFSAACTKALAELRTAALHDRDQWIVCGLEAHVCVYQSVRDLLPATVHVMADAVASRTKANWRSGLALMDRLGAIVSTTETSVFDLLERAGSDTFKALSKAIK